VSIPSGEDPMPTLTFGRVPEPPYTRLIVPKDRSGQGFTFCPPRTNIGLVPHETQGNPAGDQLVWYRNFFACPNGERCANALVDWVCDRAGRAAMLNDPNGTREPWASGGTPNASDPSGFNRYFGSGLRNRIMESVEFVKLTDDRLTPGQIAWGAARAAYVADRDGQRWDEYPRPAKYGGVHMMPMHFQLSQTSCNQHPDDMAAMIAGAKAIMREHQTSVTPTPPTPAPTYAEPRPLEDLAAYTVADTSPAVVRLGKQDFLFVHDRVRAVRNTPRRQLAYEDSPHIGPPIKKGEDFTVRWMVKAGDNRWYYITPWWTRVLAEDVERIRDLP
jgi:hypothetical protein